MGFEIGEVVFELAARHLLPALVAEVSSFVIDRTSRRVVGTLSEHAGPSSLVARPTATVQAELGPMAPATRVVSDVPGRVRLEVAGLRRNPARAEAIAAHLRRIPGVSGIGASPNTGRVLVHYDPERVRVGLIRAAIDDWDRPTPLVAMCAPACQSPRRQRRRRLGTTGSRRSVLRLPARLSA